jgi:hypothetical protein
MSPNIGAFYIQSIGETYLNVSHAVGMGKPPQKTLFDRAEEAAREKLKKKKATQTDIAKLAGIAQPSVHEWKTGGPRIAHARTFAKNTGVCVEWLYTGEGPKRPTPPPDPDLARVYDRWEHLSLKTQGRILQLVEDDAGSASDFLERRR